MGQPGWDAFRVRLARRSPRAASGRPPVPVKPAAPAVEAETGRMKPRPSRFVDNKLKQRVMQVCSQHGRASPRFAAHGHFLRAAPTSNSTSRPPSSGSRRGPVDNCASLQVVRGLPSPLWGGVSGSPGPWEGAACGPQRRPVRRVDIPRS